MEQHNFIESAAIDASEYAMNHGIVYLDLLIDYAFKTIFGSPGCEEDLLYLLQNIIPGKDIASVKLSPTEQTPDLPYGKKVIYDIFCESADGSHFVVEMQIAKEYDFLDRMVFYSTFPIRNQILRGEKGYRLSEVYVVSLTDFIIPGVPANSRVINRYTIRNDEDSSVQMTKGVNFITVELPKVKAKGSQALPSGTENLLRAIRDMGQMGSIPEEFKGDRHLERLFEKSIFANMTQESQREYISRIMGEIDRKSTLNTAHEDGVKEGLEKGRKEGLTKGLKEGRKEGRKEGLAQGKEEGRKEGVISTARRMLAEGLDVSVISKYTGLSTEEVKAIQSE